MATTYDVVCGMSVDPATSESSTYEGTTYYFCCGGCKGAFERSPDYQLEQWAEEHPGVDPTPAE